MWEEILDKVEDSRDLRNFCKAWKYPDWDKRLHRTKQCWLFDQVKFHLKDYRIKYFKLVTLLKWYADIIDFRFFKVFPLIFYYIPTKSQILLCRLVCKRWQNAIDNFLENNSSRRPHPSDDICSRLAIQTKFLHSRGLLHTRISTDKISSILSTPKETFSISGRNPIIGRSVYLNLPDNQRSLLLAGEFLKVVGHHIWDIRLEIRENSPLEFFVCLERQLKYLPNLKRLEIFGIIPVKLDDFDTNLKILNLPRLNFLETL